MTLWSKLLNKILCNHEWDTHIRVEYPHTFPATKEILICRNCGKIKKLDY